MVFQILQRILCKLWRIGEDQVEMRCETVLRITYANEASDLEAPVATLCYCMTVREAL